MLLRIAAAAAVLLAGARMARADTPAEEAIRWEAPEGCPDAAHLRARVVANLQRELSPDEVEATLTVTRQGDRWRVDMSVRTAASGDEGPGVRSLDAATCGELAESAALILAMTIADVAAMAEPSPPEPPAAPATPVVRDDERPPAADLDRRFEAGRTLDPLTPTPIDIRMRATVGGDLGSLPAVAPGLGGSLEVALGAWSGDVTVQRFAERDALMPGGQGQGAHVGLTTIAARGCVTGRDGRVRAIGCAGGEVTITRASGFGFTENFPESTTTGGGPQLGLAWAMRLFGPIHARVDVTATWHVVRTTLVEAEEHMVVHDPNRLVWRGFTGLEVALR